MKREQAISFLNEAARFFERRPTGGEDMAFWANKANAENCRKIAVMLAEDDTPPCVFCGKPAGSDSVSDAGGEVACKPCGEAELVAQREEGFR